MRFLDLWAQALLMLMCSPGSELLGCSGVILQQCHGTQQRSKLRWQSERHMRRSSVDRTAQMPTLRGTEDECC